MNDATITDMNVSGPALAELDNQAADYPSPSEVTSAVTKLLEIAVKRRQEEIDAEANGYLAGNLLPPEHPDGADGEVDKACPDLAERFGYFCERWPSYAGAVTSHLQAAKAAISAGQLSSMAGVVGVLAHWSGEAKHDFQTYFVNPLVSLAITNQQAVLEELTVAMAGYEGVLRAAHIDAKVLADEATKVLDSLNDWSSDDTSQLLNLAGVAVVIVTAATAPATGGASLAFGLGLLGAGIATAQAAITTKIDADGVLDVMAQIDSALTDMKTAMDAEEQALADGLDASLAEINRVLASATTLDTATLLPGEPTGDRTPNLGNGRVPGRPDFHPHD